MVDDEQTVERPDGREAGKPAASDADTARDEAAQSFFNLDEDLNSVPTSSETGAGLRRGLVVDAERIDRSAVPDGYPIEELSDRAVALTVDFGVETTTVYLVWPDDADEGVPLTWLLDAMDIELRDLYGRDVLVAPANGYETLCTPDESPRGSDKTMSLLGGMAFLTAVLGLAGVAGGVGLPIAVLWLCVSFGWFPYAMFTDAWYRRTHSAWDGGPLFWATLSGIPVLNLLVGAVYLRNRHREPFFGGEQSPLSRAKAKIRSWL